MTDLRLRLADIDLGNLLFEDKAPLQNVCGDKITEKDIDDISLICTRHFLQELWKLPQPLSRLPRFKLAPKTRDLARWERYARIKGIHNKKKSKKVWDETTKSWKPRWGKGRADDIKDKWVLEVPDNADPYEDQFEKLKRQKADRAAKNEFQRLRNISHAAKAGRPNPAGILAEVELNKSGLSQAYRIASTSDASLGRFTQDVNIKKIKKKTEKNSKIGKKVKFRKAKGRNVTKQRQAGRKGSRNGKTRI